MKPVHNPTDIEREICVRINRVLDYIVNTFRKLSYRFVSPVKGITHFSD